MSLKHIKIIAQKEFGAYFNSPLAYIFITVFLTFSSWFFFRDFFLNNTATMRNFFLILPWFLLFLIPAITMRLWAEEQKMGTLEVLMTSPVTETEVVLAKFFASLAFLSIALLSSLILPVILFFLGNPDIGMILCGYLGIFFLGAAYLSVGLWVSGLTNNQIIAFILSSLFIFILLVIGEQFILQTTPHYLVPVFKYIGIGTHFKSMARGVLDTRDIVYYVLFIIFFLNFNIVSLKLKRLN